MDNDNVRAEINALEIGEAANFPLERLDYVLSCRNRLQAVTGKKFSSKRNKSLNIVTITRKEDDKPK